LREDLPALVSQLAAIAGVRDLALTTNGSLLAGSAEALAAAGLRRVTVSLDSIDPDIFLRTSGGSFGVERVLEGIRAAERAGLSPIKINAVIVRRVNESSIVDLARRFRGTGHILRFIEFMDVGNINGWNLDRVVPASEILERLRSVFPLEPVEAGYRGEVARRYRYVDGGGEVGVIGSVTRPFCGDCTRLRLSTDGKLFTCLFGGSGTDLKGPIRAGASDGELIEIISACWRGRDDRYSEQRASLTKKVDGKIEMYQIGG
jgi:cyclic pyranopterin phosphate synthase